MEELTHRERIVVAAMSAFARTYGRWGTTREIGDYIAKQEGKETLAVNSTFKNLRAKGVVLLDGKSYSIKGYSVQVRKAVLVKKKDRASTDAL